MFGCCKQAMAIKFADKDGIVDQSYVDENYPVGSKSVSVEDTTSQWAELVLKKTGEYPKASKIIDPEGNHHDYCRCPCHWRGGPTVMC